MGRDQTADYYDNGCLLLKSMIPDEVASNMTFEIQKVISQVGDKLLAAPRVGEKPAYELYGYRWWPMATFHMALTPLVESIVERSILPTYSFFRSYQAGDVCRIHADRAACQHSMSLTLAYAENKPWALSVGEVPLPEDGQFVADQHPDYGDEAYAEFPMAPGDAVLYQGVTRRHGRLQPNPNSWSAHMFLHWVDKDGPYAAEAYDGHKLPQHVAFRFPVN
jgi:hypothetical protein